jgi:hypothetical protein
MSSFLHVIDGVIPLSLCQELLFFLQSQNLSKKNSDMNCEFESDRRTIFIENKDIVKSLYSYALPHLPLRRMSQDSVTTPFLRSTSTVLQREGLVSDSRLRLVVSSPTKHFGPIHIDCDDLFLESEHKMEDEDGVFCDLVSLLVYLNDDFEGGETRFYLHTQQMTTYTSLITCEETANGMILTVKPKQGRIVLFESSIPHCALPFQGNNKMIAKVSIVYRPLPIHTTENDGIHIITTPQPPHPLSTFFSIKRNKTEKEFLEIPKATNTVNKEKKEYILSQLKTILFESKDVELNTQIKIANFLCQNPTSDDFFPNKIVSQIFMILARLMSGNVRENVLLAFQAFWSVPQLHR